MKKSLLSYCLGFCAAVLTTILIQSVFLFCTPVIVLSKANPEQGELMKSCGVFSDLFATGYMQIAGSLIGLIFFFLIANLLYSKFFLNIFTRKK